MSLISAESTENGLDDLIAKTFSFPEWKTLAKSKIWPAERKGEMYGELSVSKSGITKCTFTHATEDFIGAKELGILITALLKSNGQLEFIRTLFTDSKTREHYEIKLQVDYVPSKPAFQDRLELHKDGHPLKTGLLFFSLLFLNEKEILGPEFAYDNEQYELGHTNLKLWPEKLIANIRDSRKTYFDGKIHATKIDSFGCVSVCDPLVFHSTPAIKKRKLVESWNEYATNLQAGCYGECAKMVGYEIALAMLETPGNLVSDSFETVDNPWNRNSIRNKNSRKILDFDSWLRFLSANKEKLEGVNGEISQFLRNHPLRLTGRVVDVSHNPKDKKLYMRDIGPRSRQNNFVTKSDTPDDLDLHNSRAYLRLGVSVLPKETQN